MNKETKHLNNSGHMLDQIKQSTNAEEIKIQSNPAEVVLPILPELYNLHFRTIQNKPFLFVIIYSV